MAMTVLVVCTILPIFPANHLATIEAARLAAISIIEKKDTSCPAGCGNMKCFFDCRSIKSIVIHCLSSAERACHLPYVKKLSK